MMKLYKNIKNLINIILLFNIMIGFGQTQTPKSEQDTQIDICIDIKNRLSNQSRGVLPEYTYDEIFDRILSQIGLKRNFELVECPNINNAVARPRFENGNLIRYIAYDPVFMKEIEQNSNDWAKIGILAHEIGHHLNIHNFTQATGEERRKQELEADEFAGFILQKLGASLSESKKFINVISDENDDSYSTHPKRSLRLKAIEIGYMKALEENKDGEFNDSSNKPYNAPENSSEDCEINSIGDFCFTNNSKVRIGINIGDRESRPDRYVNRAYSVKDLTLEPGETQCFYDYKAKAYKFSVYQGGTTVKTGNIKIEKCQSKNLEIGSLSTRNTSRSWRD